MGNRQCLAVGLCWGKSDFEAAVSAHRAGADHIACCILHGDGAAHFAFTAQGQAICANTQAGRGFRGSGVACYHAANLRDIARFVGQGDVNGLPVGLRAVEDDREITLSVHNACANLQASRVFDDNRAASLTFTRQCQTIIAHSQIGRSVRGSRVACDHADRWRSQATGIGQSDAQGFTVGLRFIERYFEAAISTDNPCADWQASRIFDSNGGARLAFTGHRQAISADNQTGRRLRRNSFADNHWRRRRDVAGLVSQGHFKGGAIALSGIQGDFETAISPHNRRTDLLPVSVFNDNRAARFTFTGENHAIGADCDIGWRIGGRGVACYHATDLRDVARFVGQGDAQGFAVGLCFVENDGEIAFRIHNAVADLQTCRVFDDNGATDFAFTGQGQAICAYRQVSWSRWRGGIACNHAATLRDIASRIGLSDSQCFAVGLCWRKSDFEAAVSAHRAGADHITCRILHGDGAAHFAFTAQGQAICANTQAGRGFRGSGVACYHATDLRDVARFIGQGDVEGFAVGLCCFEGDREGAICTDCPRANHVARWIFDSDGGTRLAFTRQRQTIVANGQISWCFRSGGVACYYADRWRSQATRAGEGHAQGFAVGLCGAQGDVKVAVISNSAGADHIARRVFDRHGRTRLAFTRHRQAISANNQTGWRLRRNRFTHNYRRRRRYVAGLVSQGHFKGGAIALSGVEGDFKTAVSPNNRCTDLLTVGVFNNNRAARLAFTGEGQAIGAHSQIGWRIRRCDVGVHNAADGRYLAFAVS